MNIVIYNNISPSGLNENKSRRDEIIIAKDVNTTETPKR